MPRRKKLPLEIRLNPNGTLDEVVCENAYVHLERVNNAEWSLRVMDDKTGKSVNVWLVARGKIMATIEAEGM